MENNSTYYIGLITKYFCGEAMQEEMVLLSDWLRADAENLKLFEEYQNAWMNVEKVKINALDMNNEWNRLKSSMAKSHASTASIPNPKSQIPNPKYFNTLLKIAAVFLLVAVASFVLYNYYSQPATKHLLASNQALESNLPDGTSVTLNSGSSLDYPEKFINKTRTVALKGEAYFQVKHDEAHPFVITAEDIRVEVLGTSFYVNTNTENGNIEIILSTGKVAVYHKDKPSEQVILAPGEKAEFSKAQLSITKSANDDENYIAWKTKKLVFLNDPLNEIVRTLNKIYHTNIHLTNDKIANCRITAAFDNQSLDAVLNVLKETVDLKISNSGATIEISGEGCK
ncbi:MAG: FecR domain-containing protein [Bacteroidia bacterium]|nr:FecR domain-containing protein [Bacteroidia bacterium]